ncbi:uncharacterized protein LOC141629252 [Silene latifolia]|uniref:uncharacterized protein LOC141629252 n=1 Tax=Silene latifolia TaxID=37657 RepID=UPI003D77E903
MPLFEEGSQIPLRSRKSGSPPTQRHNQSKLHGTGRSELCGLTYSAAKRHATEAKGDRPEYSCRISRQDLPSVTFDETDAQSAPEQHHDALIITLPIGNCEVMKIIVDTRSSVNLILLETLKGMRFSEKELAKKAIPLFGFSGETKHSLGEIVIPTYAGGVNKKALDPRDEGNTFNIPPVPEVPNTLGSQCIQDEYIEHQQAEQGEITLDALHPERTMLIRSECTGNVREELVRLLRTNMDCFAWSHNDMIEIDRSVITHKLSVDPSYKPVQQKRRKFASERKKVINQEVDNLLAAGKIREAKYPEWLSNVVVVPKKNGKWRVCVILQI